MSKRRKGILISVAGFDPTAGAGVLLDLNVFRALGFRGMAVLTALTVQDTRNVRKVRILPAGIVLSQYRALARDVRVAGVKVGMLGSGANLEAAARILSEASGLPRVVDPVLKSSSGAWLLNRGSLRTYLSAIKGRLTLLTPNIEEACLLSGIKIMTVEEMEAAARRLSERILAPCLVKGGHLKGAPVNVLFDGAKTHLFDSPRVHLAVHGTGCFFSSAVLAKLAEGCSVASSCRQATRLTRKAIRTSQVAGRGRRLTDPGS